MPELFAVSKWVFGKLEAVSTITDFVGKHPSLKTWQIFKGQQVQGSNYPFVLYSYQGGNYPRSTHGRKIFLKSTYMVKVVFSGISSAPGEAILNEFEKLFQQDQTKDDTVVIGCSISSPIEYTETIEGGVQVWHQGYVLDIFAYVVPN
jgi:hypothetical protein